MHKSAKLYVYIPTMPEQESYIDQLIELQRSPEEEDLEEDCEYGKRVKLAIQGRGWRRGRAYGRGKHPAGVKRLPGDLDNRRGRGVCQRLRVRKQGGYVGDVARRIIVPKGIR